MELIEQLSLEFARWLTEGNYTKAHGYLTFANRLIWTSKWLRKKYEKMIEYGDGPAEGIELVQSDKMEGWASYKKGDIGWVYVAIYGPGFNEAVALIFKDENGSPKVRNIEWGRP